jgi:uracil-DNA glycosylase family 4
MLYEFGFASHEESLAADDELRLTDCRITNAVKCLPPDNKPVGAEINTCNRYLANELRLLPELSLVLALGGIAHRAIIKALALRQADHKFGHAVLHDLGQIRLLEAYHCSRYNTNTGRLTTEMFAAIFAQAQELLDK